MYHDYLEEGRLTTYLFHGVIKTPLNQSVRNFNRKHIEAEYFSKILVNLLKNGGTPLSPIQVMDFYEGKLIPSKKYFLLTFDDGFANNFHTAFPILKSLNIPALIYLTKNFITKNEMSWIDQIDAAVDQSDLGSIQFEGRSFYLETLEQKIDFCKFVREILKNRNCNLINEANNICEKLGITEFVRIPELDDKLNTQQIDYMLKSELIYTGAHTVTHPILSFLSNAEQDLEITASIDFVSHLNNGERCKYFSYPEGHQHSFNNHTLRILRRNKIAFSPTTFHGNNLQDSDPLLMKRVFVI